MVADDVVVLARAHELFAGSPGAPGSAAGVAGSAERGLGSGERLTGASFEGYRQGLASGRVELRAAGGTDERLVGILKSAVADHGATQQATRVILDAARNDAAPAADTPMGQRELMRRKAARLRAQHRTVSGARLRALRRRALIRALHYRARRTGVPTAPLNAAARGKADERGLQKFTRKMNRAVSAAFPEIREIGGVRPDSLKWHPNGLALDIMIPNWDTPAGHALGNRIVNFLLANRYELGLDHMMWRQRQINADGSVSAMGNRGSATENHFDHIHAVSIGGGL